MSLQAQQSLCWTKGYRLFVGVCSTLSLSDLVQIFVTRQYRHLNLYIILCMHILDKCYSEKMLEILNFTYRYSHVICFHCYLSRQQLHRTKYFSYILCNIIYNLKITKFGQVLDGLVHEGSLTINSTFQASTSRFWCMYLKIFFILFLVYFVTIKIYNLRKFQLSSSCCSWHSLVTNW